MFGSRVGYSGTADRMALFPVSPNPRWRLATRRHLGKFQMAISLERIIHFVFDPRVGFSGTADRMDLLLVMPNPRFQDISAWNELSDPLSCITEQLGRLAYRRK